MQIILSLLLSMLTRSVNAQNFMNQNNTMIWPIGVLLCLIVTVIVVLWAIYRKKKNIQKIVTQESEKTLKRIEELGEKEAELKKLINQLEQDNENLNRNNVIKNKLLSIISHDLRSPISSLQSLLKLFNSNTIERKDLIDFFGNLRLQVENTFSMLENLLHWSQYQLNGIEPIFEDVNIQQIVDESIHFYQLQAEQKHIVVNNPRKTGVHTYADKEMFRIVLRNLISNAVKFTPSDGVITIETYTEEGFVIISVKDTGIGIQTERQASIFGINNNTTLGTNKEKGTGLGLILCKDFVELNCGKIWLDSEENKGSAFYFSIPITN